MLVKCLEKTLSAVESQYAGDEKIRDIDLNISIGKTYVVLGVSFRAGRNYWYDGLFPTYEILDDADKHVSAPSTFFKIVDGRPSQFWRLRQHGSNGASLWPKEFCAAEFFDNLVWDESAAIASLRRVATRLRYEAAMQGSE